jgi:ATP-dependent Clp protease ATP-binding subunit ClpA
MFSICGRTIVNKTACDLILTGYYIESEYGCRVMDMREYTTMHHPEALCGSGIDYIDMSSTIIL